MSGCQLFCNPDGSTNGLATFLTWVVVAAIVGGVALVVIAWIVTAVTGERGRPRRPVAANGPVVRGTVRGYRHLTYSAPVDAVTPDGVRVHRARCCQRGHQYPGEAADHAVVVAGGLARFGR